MSSIEAQHIDITYPGRERNLIRALSFSASSNELIAVVGANGSGKSSLLRVLAGLQDPNGGVVKWNGVQLADIPGTTRPKLAANLFSSYQRVAGMIARDLIAFGRQPYTGIFGKLKSSDWQVVDQTISQLGISSLANAMVENLSDGEYRKVMFARMWAQEADTMILDEPMAHLDMPTSVAFVRQLATAVEQYQKTVIFSTHDMPLAFNFAHQILVIDGGDHLYGTPEMVIKSDLMHRFLDKSGIEFEGRSFNYKPDP